MQIDPNSIRWDDQPQAPAPRMPAPVMGGRRVIGDVPPSERRAEQDQAMQRKRFELDLMRTQAQIDQQAQANAPKAPSGYRYKADGSLEPIPGGPAERSRDGGAIPVSAANVARESVGQFTSLERALGTFKDDFAGNTLTGGLENTIDAVTGLGTPGQSEWWADFRSTDNLIRNSLFGASLTEGEKAAYNETTISPRMTPEKIRANLKRRAEIVRGVLAREKEFYLANGYKPEAVEALFSPISQSLRTTEAAGNERQDQPPAFGANMGNGAPPPQGPSAPPPLSPIGPDYRPGAGMDGGNSNERAAIAQGNATREDNPALAGVRQEYARRLASGATGDELVEWARSVGVAMSPTAEQSIRAQVQFRDQNPNVPIEQYDTTQLDDRFVRLSAFDQAVNAVGGSAPGAFVLGAADMASAGTLDNIAGALGGNAERARLAMGAVQDANPGSYLAGNVAGGVGASLGGEAVLGRLGAQAGVGRALVADTAYGAATGAGTTDNGNRAMGALQGAGAASLGSLGGQTIGNALARTARGTASAPRNALMGEGVDLTVGQAYGGSGRMGQFVKGVEDRLSGIPFVGEAVNAQRAQGLRQFNQAAFRKALEPIGGDVGDRVGYEAIAEAQRQVSEAFTRALSGRGATADPEFAQSLGSSVARVQGIPRIGEEISSSIQEVTQPYFNGNMLTGDALDDISRNLRDIKASYRNDPLFTRAADAIDAVERSFFDLFDRQASGTVQGYQEARRAYRRLSTLENAVLRAKNQPSQTFTAAQLGQADAANTTRFGGKRAAARGDTPFNELQQAGQEVLPNQVPDSGTAGRFILPLLAIGGGGGADASGLTNGTGLTVGAVLASVYTPAGRRALTKAARGMKAGTRRRAVMESPSTRRGLGATGAAGSAALLGGPQ